jgi:hypothetical protein
MNTKAQVLNGEAKEKMGASAGAKKSKYNPIIIRTMAIMPTINTDRVIRVRYPVGTC